MKISELRAELQRLEAQGKGDVPVIWESVEHTYDVILRETTRGGKPVLVVNA